MRPLKMLGLASAAAVAALLLANHGATRMVAKGPLHVSGGGQCTAAEFVSYVGRDGVVRDVPSYRTQLQSFDFAFTATRMPDGSTFGQIQIVGNSAGRFHSDVALVDQDPVHDALFGTPPGRQGQCFLLASSGAGVWEAGNFNVGEQLVISPAFDSEGDGPDALCIQLLDQAGRLRYQWSGFVSAGDIQSDRK